MFIIYQIIIHLYEAGISLYAILGNFRARNLLQKRKEFPFLKITPKKNELKRIWMHAASAGEWLQLLPLAEKLKAEDIEIIISAYSPSALPFLKKTAFQYFLLPADTFIISKQVIGHIRPDIFITTGKEFWPNITIQLNKLSIPYILLNAFIPTNSGKIMSVWWGIYAPYISLACCTNEFSSSFLSKFGTKKVIVSGNTKADGVLRNNDKPDFRIAEYFSDNNIVIIGSGHTAELEFTAKFLNENYTRLSNWKWLIIPHHADLYIYQNFKKQLKYVVTEIAEIDKNQTASIVYVNETGILAPLYALSSIAIIGGAWDFGLHNILEPASHHNAIIFGPEYHKISEAEEMVLQEFAISVESYSEFNIKLKALLENEILRNQYADKAKSYFDTQIGASDNCCSEIKMLLH